MVFHRYEDSKTFALIGAVSETLGEYRDIYSADI